MNQPNIGTKRTARPDRSACVVTESTALARLRWEQSAPHAPPMSVTFQLVPGAEVGVTDYLDVNHRAR